MLVPNSLRIHYIDNDAALATLVKGSSSVLSGEVITASTHSRVSSIGLRPWLDRVASEENPVDELSRGKMDGPWKLVDMSFPPILRRISKLSSRLPSSARATTSYHSSVSSCARGRRRGGDAPPVSLDATITHRRPRAGGHVGGGRVS